MPEVLNTSRFRNWNSEHTKDNLTLIMHLFRDINTAITWPATAVFIFTPFIPFKGLTLRKSTTTFQKACYTFRKACNTLQRACYTFRKACNTLQKAYYNFRKVCNILQKACYTFRKACKTSQKACYTFRKASNTLQKACYTLQKVCFELQFLVRQQNSGVNRSSLNF